MYMYTQTPPSLPHTPFSDRGIPVDQAGLHLPL